jgi:hypothetical protein
VPPALDQALVRAMKRWADERFAGADDFRTALLSSRLDTWEDLSDPTGVTAAVAPPTGVVAAAPDLTVATPGSTWVPAGGGGGAVPGTTPRRRRRPTAGVVVALVVVLALLLVALLVASTDVGRDLLDDGGTEGGAPPAAATVSVVGARSFDPDVGDVENEELAANAVDRDPATTWRTERYKSRQFGNLKSGVGLIVDLDTAHRLSQVTVQSPAGGWAAQVYVANGAPGTLEGWGLPVADSSDLGAGATTFDVGGAQGDSVLVWITDLGPTNRVEIGEVTVTT